MTLDTFFEKFELFAGAPDAVAKMRELILDLALNGSLIGLDASRWDRVALGSLGEWGSGGTPLRSEQRYYGGSIPWLVIGDLNDGIVTTAASTITEEGLANSSARMLPKGVLLIAMYGSIGKMGITGIECATNQAIAFCKPDQKRTDLRYLFHTLKAIQPALLARGQGLAQKNISQTILKAWEINLPPLAEQKRIVAKVDELMAMCDRLEAQQQERETRHAALARASLARFAAEPTVANLQFLFHDAYAIPPADLRKSILTLAVQGKLVPQDPNDEPAEELISRVAAMRRAAKAKEYAPVAEDEVPYDIPSSWSWIRLGSISLSSDSGWSPQCNAGPREGTNWGVLKVSAVSWGIFKPDENKALPSGMEARPECEVRTGDFLLSRANTEELVARSVVVDQTPPRLMMSDKIVRFTFPAEVEKAFVNLANSSDPSRAYYARNASGTSSSMKNVGREVMCNLPIPLPPLAEQRRIVAKVDELMTLVDALETQLATARTAAASLLAAAVAELTSTPAADKVSAPAASAPGRRG